VLIESLAKLSLNFWARTCEETNDLALSCKASNVSRNVWTAKQSSNLSRKGSESLIDIEGDVELVKIHKERKNEIKKRKG
jgi:hypothetical protein